MYSPLSHIDQNSNWTLAELSLEKASSLAGSIVYLCILMILGIVGNIFVLIIFYFRFSASTHRTFILTLAIYDFFACAVGAPFTIAEPFFAFTYYDEVSCKCFRFVLYYTCVASSLTLVLIAIERCRKICTPLKEQFSVQTAKRALFVVAGVISSLSASPAFVLYGNSTQETGFRNISGTKCFIKDEFSNTPWPVAFNVFLLFLAMLSTVIMSVCYFRIGRAVSRMGKANIAKRMRAAEKSRATEQSEDSSAFNGNINDDLESEMPSSVVMPKNKSQSSMSRTESMSSSKVGSTKSLDGSKSIRVKLRQKSSKWAQKILRRMSSSSGKKTLRVTKMLTFVTLAFVISYLPHLTLMIWSLLTKDLDALPTDNTYQFMFYSFLFNNLVNPFIYAAMDLKFRNELKKLLTCQFKR